MCGEGMLRLWLMIFLAGCQGYNSNTIKAADDEVSFQKNLAGICANVAAKTSPGPLMSLTELPTRFLKSHNEIRALYGVKPLVWRNDLAQYSQDWANYLRDNYGCKMHHRSILGITDGKRFGENLAWFSKKPGGNNFLGTPERIVISFSKECADYNYQKNLCLRGKMCGHFTQVVWKSTQAVGCAMAICQNDQERSEIWVCSYDPPGNITMVHEDGAQVKKRPF